MSKPSDIIARARLELNDPAGTGQTWSDEQFLQFLNDGRKEMARVRIDAFWLDDGPAVTSVSGNLTLSQDLDTREQYDLCHMFYLCYRAMNQNYEHQGNVAAAKGYLEKFVGELK